MSSPAAEPHSSSEPSPMPADGGTLIPPTGPAEGLPNPPVALHGFHGADSSLLADTSHVQQLINHGADVNAPDNNGWTPLHTAAYHGQEEIVRILLTSNANVNARNKAEETPLHLAAKWPQDRVVEALLSGGADLTARNRRGRTPAHVAALFNRHAILDRLLSAGADVNAVDNELQSPLHLAVRANCPVEPELVKTLIRHNANLELRDTKGNTPLHFLPSAQDWLHWAAYEGKEGLIAMLLAKPGVRPDCYSEEGLTPLHLAAHVNSTNMVAMLVNAGAKVNAPSQPPTKTSGKETTYGIPLPGAPGSITAGISITSQLKAYGSSKLPPGELTALHIAAERGSAELIRVLVAAGAKVNVQGERGMPPLHVAVWEGNTAAVVSLLAAKASVSLKSKAGGFTSVHCACLSSRATPELLALLLDNGGAAVIEERCQEGWTALHLACQSAPPAMVELLLQRGARPGAKGKNGRTAADCAAKRPEILQILHVATGGKVPLPLGLSSVAAAAANGLLTPNGASGTSSGSSGSAAAAARSAAAAAASGRGRAATGGGGAGSSRSPSSAASQSGLLPGTAAVLEPLESVEATLAALLADMGGALCSLQAGGVFGAGACAVDPVGHCIRPLDKRLVMVCTLGCHFSFHLQCWKSAREVLKERWPGFTGKLAEGERYCCIAPGCPGCIREQAICDGTQVQSSNQSRLYLMAQDVYDSLPPQAKPIGGGVPPPPGAGDGCIGGVGVGGMQQPAAPLQPALPAGGGGLTSLAALAPSLTLAQAMVQAATAVGNMVGGSGRIGSSQLAAALAATGGLPALLANPPPIPQAMSAREAARIAAETLGVGLGPGGGGGCSGGVSCVVEELGSGDEEEEEEGVAPQHPQQSGTSSGAGERDRGDRAGSSSRGGSGGSGTGGGGGGNSAAARSGAGASTSYSSGGTANGGSARKHGGGGSGGGSSRRVGKGGGGKALGAKGSSAPPISSAAAAEMLQQLQGLQQAVAAVQSAVGAGVHSMGLGVGSGPGAAAAAAAAGAAQIDPCSVAGASSGPVAAAAAGSAAPPRAVAEHLAATTLLEPPVIDLPPPPPVAAATVSLVGVSSGSGDDGDGGEGGSGGGGGGGLQDVAPMPPPRRRNPPMPPMPRRAPQPLSCTAQENGRQPVSPQLATPPPATSLLTPGVKQLLSPAAGVATPSAAAAPTLQPLLLRQPDASLAPILVGPVPQPASPSGTAADTNAAAAAPAGAAARRVGGSGVPLAVSTARGAAGDASGSTTTAAAATAAAAGTDGGEAASPRAHQPAATSGSDVSPAGLLIGGSAEPGTAPKPGGGAGAAAGSGGCSPRRSDSGGASGSPGSPAAAVAAVGGGGGAKLDAKPAIVNGQVAVAAASPPYGGRVSLSATGLSIGIVRGVALSAGIAGVVQAQGLPAGVTVTRAGGGKAAAAAAAGTVQHGTLPHNAASYEPGGYARAVCPGLRPGVHRVTHSTGRVMSPPAAAAAEAAAVATLTTAEGGGGEAAAHSVPPGGAASASAGGAGHHAAGPRGEAEAEPAQLPSPAACAEGDAGQGGTAAADAPPSSSASTKAPETEARAGATGAPAPVPASADAVTSPANAVVAPTATSSDGGDGAGYDIVLAALHRLREPACFDVAAAAANGAAAAPAADVNSTSAAGNPAAAAAAPAATRHLLLESVDIPLLASTPGMLEAWLSAHVGTHGRLAAHRILAPQAAVAVTLESDAAAAAAAGSLHCRPTLLVHPLTVAPLRDFPEDEVLAACAQQVAKSACSSGDRSWMRRMVELWQQLQSLPPPVQHP